MLDSVTQSDVCPTGRRWRVRYSGFVEIDREVFSASISSVDSKSAVVSYWQNNVYWVLVNRLADLNLHRKSVVRITGHFGMTIAVYLGR